MKVVLTGPGISPRECYSPWILPAGKHALDGIDSAGGFTNYTEGFTIKLSDLGAVSISVAIASPFSLGLCFSCGYLPTILNILLYLPADKARHPTRPPSS